MVNKFKNLLARPLRRRLAGAGKAVSQSRVGKTLLLFSHVAGFTVAASWLLPSDEGVSLAFLSFLTAALPAVLGAGAGLLGSRKPKPPPQREAYQEAYDAIKAQADLLPYWQEQERKARPISDELYLDSLRRLTGGEGNYLDIYEKTLAPSIQRSEDAARRQRGISDLSLLQNYAAATRRALLEADPEQKRLSDMLMASAIADMEGGGMSERDRVDLREDIRSAQAARGMGGGVSDAAIEGLLTSQYRQQLEDRARQAAGHAVGLRSQIGGDAGQTLLGRPTGTQYLQGIAPGLEKRADTNLFNPQSQFNANIAQSNYNANLDNYWADRGKDYTAIGIGQGLQTFGGLGGSLGGLLGLGGGGGGGGGGLF